MLLLLLACKSAPVPDSPQIVGDDSVVDSRNPHSDPPDSPDESPVESHESPPDSPDDSPTDSPSDTWRSALYPEDWTPGLRDGEGRGLADYSYAGYHNSELPLPTVSGPLFLVDDYGADPSGTSDSTAGIQSAIDAAEVAGGVVLFGAGTYRIDDLLRVEASNVVLRGQGSGQTYLGFTRTNAMDDRGHLTFSGALSSGAELALAEDTRADATTVRVADPSGLAPGDEVSVGQVITDDFIADHGMTGTWVSFTDQWKSFFRRTVVSIDDSVSPAVVTLDVPLRYALRTRDGASLRRESGYLRECGLESLSVSTAVDYSTAWTLNRTHAVLMEEVEDCWVRDLGSWASSFASNTDGLHLLSGGVKVLDSKRVTIADSTLGYTQNRGGGGNGYVFEISRSNEILVRDSQATAGRHNFIQNWDYGTSGCVWLRVHSSGGNCRYADWDPVGWTCISEYHHSIAMANLVDSSVLDDGWQGVNRQDESSGAGHSATEDVFWNVSGAGYVRSLQYGWGYVIGTQGLTLYMDPTAWDWANAGEGTEPADWLEGDGEGATLSPQSLFEDQLARRLGG